ncbi:MAG: bifunctional ADP-dependent NAD(P)H-hydrate dehydratase/NAD(P)H-hydrate epimerase [Candidatus Thorarchaeota archaeon]|nr:MAG: bifunctional ADP-dependent NAD(P)H-hydrate dehydratase/NAD(P)H-hydrate epimerase [Candidatus Thorarchaeota archaeon]
MDGNSITTDEMRALEMNAKYLGVSHSVLMQIAGREVARVIIDNESVGGKSVVILCGLGGNGGDGIVAARYLDEAGARVEVYLLGHEKTISNPDTMTNWNTLKNLLRIFTSSLQTESAVRSCRAIGRADILIDGLMGFGLHSELREPLLTAVRMINRSKAIKYSIDVPSGIDSDTGAVHGDAVKADHTIALHASKIGTLKAPAYVGKTHVVTIGIPREAADICGPGDLSYYNRPRESSAKKGDFGRILVIGGSDVFSGAPALAGMAALRSGSDLVTVLAPDPVVPAIREYSPNLMVKNLGAQILVPEVVDAVLKVSESNDVVAFGPGLGLDSKTKEAAVCLIQQFIDRGIPLVLDADGLKAIASSGMRFNPDITVFTPHWGELSVIMESKLGKAGNLQNRTEQAVKAAKLYDAVILLKGPIDVITHPTGRIKWNRTGVPAMTVGGTGDVLTGIVASLLSRNGGAFRAAAASAFVSGLAGEMAAGDLGDHIVATDCIERIPHVFATL